jgi:hypothetical protein
MATLFGDSAGSLTNRQKDRHQVRVGTDNQEKIPVGDADNVSDHAKGGNDALIGGINSQCGTVSDDPRGDALTVSGSTGGSDIVDDEWKLRAIAESW